MTPQGQRYPGHLTEAIDLADGRRVVVRPARPRDVDLQRAFFRALSEQDRYFRFMAKLGELTDAMAQQFGNVDHVRHVALLGCVWAGAKETVVGEARYFLGSDDPGSAEFTLAVAGDWQGIGLARARLARLIGHAAAAGVRRLVGDTLAANVAMLELAKGGGFAVSGNGADRRLLRLVKDLGPQAQRWPLPGFAVPA